MTATPDRMAETPILDLLSDVLRRVHLASAVFLRGEFTAPWAFASTDATVLAQVVRPTARRLVLFHVVVEGQCRVTLANGETTLATAGDAVVMPYCDVHTMGFPEGTTPVPIAELLPPPPWHELPVVRIAGGGAPTSILCGYLDCEDLLFNPLLRALPRLLRVQPASPPAAKWREASLAYALARGEAAGDGLLARVPELVLADCLRQHLGELPAQQRGWLAALRDSVLAKVLIVLHSRPEAAWTVTALAREAAVSRSVLAARFTETLGVTPIRYLAQWRLQIAADLLRDTNVGIADLAARIGYESESAFSRAFKRHLGISPAHWRAGRRRDALLSLSAPPGS